MDIARATVVDERSWVSAYRDLPAT